MPKERNSKLVDKDWEWEIKMDGMQMRGRGRNGVDCGCRRVRYGVG